MQVHKPLVEASLATLTTVAQFGSMHCVLIVAQSLDGFITRHETPGTAWASAADQAWFRRCLSEFDASVMGRVTYEVAREQIHASLNTGTTRRRIIMTRTPDRFAAATVPGRLDFSAATAHEIHANLTAAGHQRCALLGGAQVHDAFLAAGLVNEIRVTIEPRIFGRGTPVVQARHDLNLRLHDQTRLDDSDSIVLRYEVIR